MSRNLLVELDECSRLGRVLVLAFGASKYCSLLLDLTSGLGNLFASPVNSVDLLAKQAEQTELVRRTFLRRNELIDTSFVVFNVRRERFLLFLAFAFVLLQDGLSRQLEQFGFGRLEFVASLLAAFKEVRKFLEVPLIRQAQPKSESCNTGYRSLVP